MKYLIVGIIVVIAVLAFVLSRRGSAGVGSNGSTDTIEGALGKSRHEGPGGGAGLGGGS